MKTSFDLARQHGMLSVEEIFLYKKLISENIENIKPIVVNVGAGFGTSAIALLEEKPEAFVFSVDIKVADAEKMSLWECGIDLARVVRVLGDSGLVGKFFPIEIDVLFIDGEHTVEQVRADAEAWVPKVRSGGLIMFHDYAHPNVPDITPLINDLLQEFDYLGKERFLIGFKKP